MKKVTGCEFLLRSILELYKGYKLCVIVRCDILTLPTQLPKTAFVIHESPISMVAEGFGTLCHN